MASPIHIKPTLSNDKGYWRVRARVYNPQTGKTVQRSQSTGFRVDEHTKRKAEQTMKQIVLDWEREANAEVLCANPLFSETLSLWRSHKATTLRESTLTAYDYNINKHILPYFGKMRTRDITMYNVRSFYDELLKSHKVKTVRKIHLIISGAMQDAVINKVRSDNPAEHISLPKAEKFEGTALDESAFKTLLAALEHEQEPIKSAMLLALLAGLRREEVCGLRWTDVDFTAEAMHIQNTVVQNGGQIWELELTKTPKSNRTLYMGEYLAEHLKALKAAQEAAGLKLDKVCRWTDGKPVEPSYISHAKTKVLKRCGISDIRFHDLRHTAGSYMAKHATPKQVQAFLGHEDISTTMNIYVHSDESDKKLAADIMDGLAKSAVVCSEKCSERSNQLSEEQV